MPCPQDKVGRDCNLEITFSRSRSLLLSSFWLSTWAMIALHAFALTKVMTRCLPPIMCSIPMFKTSSRRVSESCLWSASSGLQFWTNSAWHNAVIPVLLQGVYTPEIRIDSAMATYLSFDKTNGTTISQQDDKKDHASVYISNLSTKASVEDVVELFRGYDLYRQPVSLMLVRRAISSVRFMTFKKTWQCCQILEGQAIPKSSRSEIQIIKFSYLASLKD